MIMKRLIFASAILLMGIVSYGQAWSAKVLDGDTLTELTNNSYIPLVEMDGTPSNEFIRLNPLFSSISGWLKSGTNLSPATTGDDLLLGNTEYITFGDGDTYISQTSDDYLNLATDNVTKFTVTPTNISVKADMIPNQDGTKNLGALSYGYDSLYVDDVVATTDVTIGGASVKDMLKDSLGTRFNILSYGAISDDGLEDQTAIQAAINAAAAFGSDPQGGTVIIPAGKWYITAPVVLKSYMKVKADQNAYFYFPASYTGSMYTNDTLDLASPAISKLMWCSVEGGYYGSSSMTRTWKFLDLYGTDDDSCFVMFSKFRNIDIENCDVGINLRVTNDGWINGNTFENIVMWRPLSGVRTRESASSSGLGNNAFLNLHIQTQSSVTNFGLDSISGDYNLWNGLHIYDVGGTTVSGVLTSTCTNNVFIGGTLDVDGGWNDLGDNNYFSSDARSLSGREQVYTSEIVAGTGITKAMLIKNSMITMNPGSAIDFTADPQIANGASGQIIVLQGRSNTNTVTIDDGNGVQLAGGTSMVLGLWDTLTLIWTPYSATWIEIARSDN